MISHRPNFEIQNNYSAKAQRTSAVGFSQSTRSFEVNPASDGVEFFCGAFRHALSLRVCGFLSFLCVSYNVSKVIQRHYFNNYTRNSRYFRKTARVVGWSECIRFCLSLAQ